MQAARRDAGLEVSDRIVLTLDGDAQLLDAARAHEAYIAGETLAVAGRYESVNDGRARPRRGSTGASCRSQWRSRA